MIICLIISGALQDALQKIGKLGQECSELQDTVRRLQASLAERDVEAEAHKSQIEHLASRQSTSQVSARGSCALQCKLSMRG